ncbi:hypothetical protein [Amycolatopsis sp. MtRt-6]|nr:hypothetical protein [Amycolatopsis sp. MtRt-6]
MVPRPSFPATIGIAGLASAMTTGSRAVCAAIAAVATAVSA